ncbi:MULTISPECIES: rolling circle replication-associated protein [Burkholderiaceae]|uniref:rolling circle replication-associated protein n=1 Tax=Burkholderiaceae TaxID=119060 RepID=UPI000F06DD87|nr:MULTISPECIES: hypothetical protein [Burkholderiaceae]CAJ0700275.1 hypothetical protein LMG18102_03179 [Ralstonia mannitolilytica]CAJ3552427.1 Uncharacterised protein [Burkholderia pseudomallei]CAJ5966715.1 Uncharacterised protein [Burkholderia pseudomallei]CAJ7415709.1 Uncharacterised protein [Burkholderia pseudomallei]CAJ9261444.1 Uncharacterised protein [Burkholderia pseudomallei]
MLHQALTVAARPSTTPVSVTRFAELVKKIGTSATASSRKRKNAGRKKLNSVVKEQRRYAKLANLRAVAVTLMYLDAATFSQKHISAFLGVLRQALKRMGYRLPYAWVLERASHLHYHLLVWLPRDYTLDLTKLGKWWPWGSTWVGSCRSVKAWRRYMAKFDSATLLPKGARLYGYGGLDSDGKLAVSRAALPRWLLALLPAGHHACRNPGGGWADLATGEVHRSPYVWTPWGSVLRGFSDRCGRPHECAPVRAF